MTDHEDRRRFSRISLDAPVTLSQGSQRQRAQLLDISLKGMLLQPDEPLALDDKQPVQSRVRLTEQAIITMEARVLHRENGLLGLACLSIDLDSIAHLRRLLELNLADAGAAERELAELIPQ